MKDKEEYYNKQLKLLDRYNGYEDKITKFENLEKD